MIPYALDVNKSYAKLSLVQVACNNANDMHKYYLNIREL